MKWYKPEEKLPKNKKYVLAIHNRGTWHDKDDQNHVNYVVVKFIKGLTEEDRQSNNLKPYCWRMFGGDYFFGQNISCWTYLPELKEE